jgi:hypothetical protein
MRVVRIEGAVKIEFLDERMSQTEATHRRIACQAKQ